MLLEAWECLYIEDIRIFLEAMSVLVQAVKMLWEAVQVLTRVQRGLVGSTLACCKAGPSSNLGSAPHGGSAHWVDSCEDMEMGLSECLWMNNVWMYVLYCIKKNKCKKEWNTATKPLSLFALHSILFGLNHFVSSSISPGLGRICSLCLDPVKFWTNQVRFVSFL
jgi:hypothetical protein